MYKFGGASVKDAAGVRNILRVLKELNTREVVIVISAMGKMTNAFESLVGSYFEEIGKAGKAEDMSDFADFKNLVEQIKKFHFKIVADLGFGTESALARQLQTVFEQLVNFPASNSSKQYDFVYDQIVSFGEILSTLICSAYLNENNLENKWLDVRRCIRTNSDYRRARIDWEKTCENINTEVDTAGVTLTQGFLGCDQHGYTTTLGREGSDYTAGVIAYCLNANEVSIFKDVPGVLNADPREFDDPELLNQISYKEAIEMAFFGASVIHPKTLQPLQRREIPLRVRSFLHPKEKGTTVKKGIQIHPEIPCFIVKKKQILLSVSDEEFHFVMEEDISEIFALLHLYKMKVNLIQNSAISFSVCIEDNFDNFDQLFEALKPKYKVLYNKDLTLFTVRHFNEKNLEELEKGRTVLLKQLSRETAQLVVK